MGVTQSDFPAGGAEVPMPPSDAPLEALTDKVAEVSPIRFNSTGHKSATNGPGALLAVHGLVFEMANVLYDASLWRRWLFKLLTRIGVQSSYHSFFQVWDRDYLVAVRRGQGDYHEAFRTFLRSVGLTTGQVDEIEASAHARRRELEFNVRVLPGVQITLARLQISGIKLALLSDSIYSATELQSHLARLGLGERFETLVCSVEVGHTKPDPICYQKALLGLGLSADQVAFVGNKTKDLAGASAVGMQTVAFNYEQDSKADIYIDRFDELVSLISARPPNSLAG